MKLLVVEGVGILVPLLLLLLLQFKILLRYRSGTPDLVTTLVVNIFELSTYMRMNLDENSKSLVFLAE
jgi:hypothetical protein